MYPSHADLQDRTDEYTYAVEWFDEVTGEWYCNRQDKDLTARTEVDSVVERLRKNGCERLRIVETTVSYL